MFRNKNRKLKCLKLYNFVSLNARQKRTTKHADLITTTVTKTQIFDSKNHCKTILSNAGPRVIEILSKQVFCCTSTAQSFFSTSSVWNLAATCLR